MLITIEKITRRGSDSPPVVVTIGINPESVEMAQPHTDKAVEGPCVRLGINGDQAIFCRGTVEQIVKQTQEAVWGPPPLVDARSRSPYDAGANRTGK